MDIGFLEEKCKWVRETTLKMIYEAGSGHPGGSLSEVEILVALYYKIMQVDSKNRSWKDRDRFVLSKGHCCPPLYAILADKGYFSIDELDKLRKYKSLLQGHPSIITPGIDTVSGSLGNGLSVGVGMAMAGRRQKRDYNVYVLLGDGELQEGCIWEAAMCAAHNKLNNIIAIVDYNKLQINGCVNDIVNLEPLTDKWESFGWDVCVVDGHDVYAIVDLLEKNKCRKEKPLVIIASTIKGKGVSFMENNCIWHGNRISESELELALREIGESYG